MYQSDRVKLLTKTAIYAGLVFLCTYFFKFPIPIGSAYFNLGDVAVYLSAIFLPPIYAVCASGIGSGIADLLYGAVIYIPATIVIKSLMAWLVAKFGKMFGILYASLLLVAGYFIYEYLVFGFGYAYGAVFYNVLQSVAGVIVFIIIMGSKKALNLKESK